MAFAHCAFIMNFMTNSYFILQIYHARSFKMRHVTSLYFNFSVFIKYFKNSMLLSGPDNFKMPLLRILFGPGIQNQIIPWIFVEGVCSWLKQAPIVLNMVSDISLAFANSFFWSTWVKVGFFPAVLLWCTIKSVLKDVLKLNKSKSYVNPIFTLEIWKLVQQLRLFNM